MKYSTYNHFIISFILSIYCISAPILLRAKQSDTLFINNAKNYKVVPSLSYIEDPDHHITLQNAVFLFNKGKSQKSTAINTFNAGVTFSSFWFKLVIKNKSKSPRLMLLGIHERVDTLLLYRQTGSKVNLVTATGFNFPYETREVPNRNFVFKVPVAPDSTYTYYLKARNTADYIYMPFVLKDADSYMAYETSRYQLLGVYSGIFLFVIIFSLFLYFSLGDKLNLWYAFYVFATLVYLMMEDGITYEIGLRNFPFLSGLLNEEYWWYGFMLLWLYIMQLFINQTKTGSIFFKITRITMVVLLLRIIIEAYNSIFHIHHGSFFTKLLFYMGDGAFFVSCILLVLGPVEQIIKKSKAATLYLAAIAFGLTGTLNIYFNYIGLTNINLVEPNAMIVGLTIEIIILSFALTARYNRFRKEKEQLSSELNSYQQSLTEKLVQAQEQERKRIAEDLHDDVSATLGVLILHISNLPKELQANPTIKKYASEGLVIARKAVHDIRSISHDLLPQDFTELGLIKTVGNKIDELEKNCNTRFELHTIGDDKHISDIYAVTIYRIINELLNNIVKHANATDASVEIFFTDKSITIIASDNGIGMSGYSNKKGIGMQNIQSRINFLRGTMVTESSARGTVHNLIVPL